MEEIQFLNYIFSILAVLLSIVSIRMIFKHQDLHENEIKFLRDKIRELESNQMKKK